MAATLDTPDPTRDALAAVAAPVVVTASRVVSVSPHAYDVELNVAAGGGEKPPTNNQLHLELLQAASDRLIALLQDADIAVNRLEASTSRGVQEDVNAGAASLQLQERLQLSAQMLKAFQAQIARVEESIGTLKSHDQHLHAAEASIDERLKDFEARVEEMLRRCAEKLERISNVAVNRIEQITAMADGARERSSSNNSQSADAEMETKPGRKTTESADSNAPLSFRNWANRG